MSLQSDITERVCEEILDNELRTMSSVKYDGGYYKIDGDNESYSSEELISKLFEIAEEKILQSASPTNTQSKQALREIAISSKIREYAKENSIHIMDYEINGLTSQLLAL